MLVVAELDCNRASFYSCFLWFQTGSNWFWRDKSKMFPSMNLLNDVINF